MRMSFLQRPLLFVTLLLLSGEILCQTLPFQSYTTRDGLPSNHITSLCQDSRGYLWIGTDNGLSMYDGTEFKNFTTADGLSNLYITDIIESKNQPRTFWIGTIAGGLVKMRNEHFSTIHIGDNNVSSLCEDMKGVIWCSSGVGDFRIIGDTTTFINATDGRGSGIEEFNGTVVILTRNRLVQFHSDGLEKVEHQLELHKAEEIVATNAVDRAGTLWAFTSEGRLMELDSSLTVRQLLRTPLKPSLDIPAGMMDDGEGLLWITTPRGILLVGKAEHTSRKIVDFGIPSLQPSGPIIKDREGTIWFGTYASGLMKLSEDRIYRIQLDPINDAAYNMVACADSNGHIWISTSTALMEVTRSTDMRWTVFRHRARPWINGHPSCALLIDPQNGLWTGPTTSGREPFCCYEIKPRPDRASQLELQKSLLPQPIAKNGAGLTFAVDQFQQGWFSFYPVGIALVDLHQGKLVQIFTADNGIPIDPPRALLADKEGRLWCGSWAAGLVVIESEADSFITRKEPSIVEGAGVRSLHKDKEGCVWIGTRYAGLVRSCNGEYKTISVNDGLLSNAIWSIAETDHRIWCGTDVGLEIVDKQTLRPLSSKAELMGNRVYACGSYGNEFVWCVLANELVVYEQPEKATNTPPPPVYIKSYTVNGIAMSPDSSHEFDYTQNSCTIDFVGISFKNEHNVKYKYRMLGHDSLWTKPTKEHTVTYASLPAGTYEFEVQAINADGIASIQPASISFVIVPPVWSRWWFIAGVALLCLSVLYGLFRYRLYHLMGLEQLRLRIASDLHDDVASTLSSIAFFTESLRQHVGKPSGRAKDLLEKISSLSLEAEDAVGDIVWSVAPQHDTLQELFIRMRDFGSDLCIANGMEFSATFNESGSSQRLSDILRKNLYLVFKEAMHNVIKHSRAAAVRLELFFENGNLHFALTDDGIGFTHGGEIGDHEVPRGHGLRNMMKRAESVRAGFTVDSSSGKGTKITLVVPMA
jgi:ligand-binding sensor domain-containing protein/anti-sigma regulatory factor (Ser/Thr protein kinase)